MVKYSAVSPEVPDISRGVLLSPEYIYAYSHVIIFWNQRFGGLYEDRDH